MKEIYRSFEGKLNPSNRSGYIIYQGDGFKEIHFLSVYLDKPDSIVRISDNLKFDFSDLAKIGEIAADIDNGCYISDKCAVFYNGKWYSGTMINKIQRTNGANWKAYV